MITACVESFERSIPELKEIIKNHWEELAMFKDKMPLSPRWDEYVARERMGTLLFVAVRKNGVMIAYYIAFISPGLHYETTLTANMDILYVVPSARGAGAGILLFNAVESELRRRGVKLWYSGYKIHNPLGLPKLLDHFGFSPADMYMAKWL